MSLVKMDSGGRLQRTSAKISDFKPPPFPVQVRTNFSNHPSPDVRVRIVQQLFLHNCFLWRKKKLDLQEDKTFNPGRYTNEIQWVNCLFTGTNY